jgi:hypothetical protein
MILPAVLALFFYHESYAQYNIIKIHDRSLEINIEDIVSQAGKVYTETDIKRICAEITKRYHSKGYTAFYIRKVILNKDGTAELFFNESVVKEINISGASARYYEIISSVYKKGDVFNEFILKDNISAARKKYNLKHIKTVIKRTDDAQIIIEIEAAEISDEFYFGIFSIPAYGILPELAFTINSGLYQAGSAFISSFMQKETSYSKLNLFLKRTSSPEKSGFIITSDYLHIEDSFYNNGTFIYEHDSFRPGAGIWFISGAARFNFLLTATYDILNNYPYAEGGTSFAGIRLKYGYNDETFRIDFNDITICSADFFSGWNFIENSPVCRGEGEYRINIPLIPGFFISLNGYFFYTSDSERFLQSYVFDRNLPCRDNDFTFSSWKGIAGIDAVIEILTRTVYIAPSLKYGLHNASDDVNDIYAAGIKGFIFTEKARFEFSYLYDIDHSVKDGYFLIAASGYL